MRHSSNTDFVVWLQPGSPGIPIPTWLHGPDHPDDAGGFRWVHMYLFNSSYAVVSLSFNMCWIRNAHYSVIPRQMVDQLISWRERSGVTTRMAIAIRGFAAMLDPTSRQFFRGSHWADFMSPAAVWARPSLALI